MKQCDDISHVRLGPSPEFLEQIDRENMQAVSRLVESIRKEMCKMNTRCKVRVESVKLLGSDGKGNHSAEEVQMRAVQGNKVSNDGSDEDNTYAKYSPSADFRLYVANPVLFGQFKPEQKYYIDMSLAAD